ncbi:MAG TPA: triose-phosphate isomerase [Elusimicrobia bacterium]|nr:triose-phosphate isomerase [Elusimicrobiota bacterium]HAU89874.1 triose-phosphate isomerase [Elusimicrobiota bacterium]
MIAGNWKMHLTSKEAADLAAAMRKGLDPDLKHEVLLAPTFTNLHAVKAAIAGSKILLASQDVAWEEKGAFTGAVSPAQIIDAGCTHAIIGHSERRKIFLETDEVINKKMKAAIKANIVPVLCIGETLEERESQRTYRVLETQLTGAFAGITAAEAARVVIAYEPVWAIGTGKTATPDQAQDAHVFVRKQMERIYGKDYAEAVRMLYGGSVKADNVDELMAQPDIDGALVGGESLKADKFLRVIHFQTVLSR